MDNNLAKIVITQLCLSPHQKNWSIALLFLKFHVGRMVMKDASVYVAVTI